MEPNKLENHIKEQLNLRTIQPSAQAWDRLDAMLTVANRDNIVEPKKSKKKFGWLFIAASFIGFLFVGTYFYNQENDLIVVEKPVEKIENSKRIETIKKNEIAKVGSRKIEDGIDKTGLVESRVTEIRNKKSSSDEAYETPSKPVLNLKPENQIANNDNLIIEPKQIDNPKSEPQIAVSVAVPHSGARGLKVDPSSLLSQVDGELTLSFREKVIKKYQTVKVALADRNNQKQ